ncbi:hypothetical protein E2C01_041626 [Portunus trituberculatus]|uniref:Uncharacterized protein n=1 Tax=Portunus trituberculatus TaxID=210409 RepID=A0A5B7FR80_PORTR|nr:hypothetical protein [Portunus trituberculatus]
MLSAEELMYEVINNFSVPVSPQHTNQNSRDFQTSHNIANCHDIADGALQHPDLQGCQPGNDQCPLLFTIITQARGGTSSLQYLHLLVYLLHQTEHNLTVLPDVPHLLPKDPVNTSMGQCQQYRTKINMALANTRSMQTIENISELAMIR